MLAWVVAAAVVPRSAAEFLEHLSWDGDLCHLGRYTYGVILRDVLREPSRAEEMLASQRDVYCKQAGAERGTSRLYLCAPF
jgi:hypothetical protein